MSAEENDKNEIAERIIKFAEKDLAGDLGKLANEDSVLAQNDEAELNGETVILHDEI